jgi:hypothetical protein
LLRRIQFAKALFGDAQQTPDDRRGAFDFFGVFREFRDDGVTSGGPVGIVNGM